MVIQIFHLLFKDLTKLCLTMLIALLMFLLESFTQCTLYQEDCGISTVSSITSYSGWTNYALYFDSSI
jgi:hypothetical protein